MAYVKYSKEFWDVEAGWIENEYKKPAQDRISQFKTYCKMQLSHCESDGTSPEAAKRMKVVLDGL